MSISDAEKTAQKVRGWLDGGSGKNKRFGPPGDRQREEKCDTFRAYLECRGYLTTEKRVVDLPPGSTLGNARESFGRPMRQQKILDEDGYELEATAPIWRYSRGCNISVTFAYARGKEVESAKHATGAVIQDTKKTIGNAFQSIRDKPRED